jgi:uncharacterized RDD family membrane protein YckC
MADDQQQSGQPPAGAPGSWPPPPPQPGAYPPPGFAPPPPTGAPGGWAQQAQPGWSQPGYPPPGYPPQGGYPPPPGYPPQGGYPPVPYGQPAGYPPPGYGYGYGPRYAGFWIRLVATIIDGLILAVIAVVCIITVVGIIALPFVLLGYMPFLWWKRGATFGQSALNLRVVRAIDGGPIDGGMACIRAIIYWLENLGGYILIGYLGFIWAAFEPRKRAWHDMAAGTVVIHTN